MNYSLLIDQASTILFVLACLVFGVNIIVEVVKKNLPKLPTSLLSTIISLALTVTAFFAWASYIDLVIRWYYIIGAVILGLFVAYAAMFGFDKFKQAFEKLKSTKK